MKPAEPRQDASVPLGLDVTDCCPNYGICAEDGTILWPGELPLTPEVICFDAIDDSVLLGSAGLQDAPEESISAIEPSVGTIGADEIEGTCRSCGEAGADFLGAEPCASGAAKDAEADLPPDQDELKAMGTCRSCGGTGTDFLGKPCTCEVGQEALRLRAALAVLAEGTPTKAIHAAVQITDATVVPAPFVELESGCRPAALPEPSADASDLSWELGLALLGMEQVVGSFLLHEAASEESQLEQVEEIEVGFRPPDEPISAAPVWQDRQHRLEELRLKMRKSTDALGKSSS